MTRIIVTLLILIATLNVSAQEFEFKTSLKDIKLKYNSEYVGADNDFYYWYLRGNLYRLDKSFVKKTEKIAFIQEHIGNSKNVKFKVIDGKIVVGCNWGRDERNTELTLVILSTRGEVLWKSTFEETSQLSMSDNGVYISYKLESETYYKVLKYVDGVYQSVGKKHLIDEGGELVSLDNGKIVTLNKKSSRYEIGYYNVENGKSSVETLETGLAKDTKFMFSDNLEKLAIGYAILTAEPTKGRGRLIESVIGIGVSLINFEDDELEIERQQVYKFSDRLLEDYYDSTEVGRRGNKGIISARLLNIKVNNEGIIYVLMDSYNLIRNIPSGGAPDLYEHLPILVLKFDNDEVRLKQIKTNYTILNLIPPDAHIIFSGDKAVLIFNDISKVKAIVSSYIISKDFEFGEKKTTLLDESEKIGQHLYNYIDSEDGKTYVYFSYKSFKNKNLSIYTLTIE